ncbi:MAG: carboxypeptidase M32 [Candidatus Lokiarchaeota archaeon]|nr:carboxypeptidase M32 [Candidatus Lokiarchaeota archaeon]MBD3201185.1 carboxypeptidase M32 [Candidatus Lokiarchaeota archaeon]
MTKIKKLWKHFSDIKKLGYTANLLHWDMQTYMPEGSNEGRSELLALIEEISHNKLISKKTKDLIKNAEKVKDLDLIDSTMLREAKRDYEKAVKVPTELVVKISRAQTIGHKAWVKSREKRDFSIFLPHLEKMIKLKEEYADKLDLGETRYDTLLDDYEPGVSSKWIADVFDDLKSELIKILDKLMSSSDKPDQSILKENYNPSKQWDFGLEVIKKFNFDFKHGRQDKAVHPFTTSLSSTDTRITTRISEDFLSPALFGTIHECGHALYDMGFMKEIHNTILANGASMGIHESQSRMYENFIGRGKEFWDYWYPTLQKYFPENLKDYQKDEFYRSINTVIPSLIRVEADEVTYSLHIILRFELERQIFEGEVDPKELPDLWNAKSEELLTVLPPNDSLGLLQDVHWSEGYFGYFPTYALGNLYCAQIYEDALEKHPNLPEQYSKGEFSTILEYLRENVHQYGRIYQPRELIQKISGKELDAKYFVKYLKDKFYPIYGV